MRFHVQPTFHSSRSTTSSPPRRSTRSASRAPARAAPCPPRLPSLTRLPTPSGHGPSSCERCRSRESDCGSVCKQHRLSTDGPHCLLTPDPARFGDVEHDPIGAAVLHLDVAMLLMPLTDAEGLVDVIAAPGSRRP